LRPENVRRLPRTSASRRPQARCLNTAKAIRNGQDKEITAVISYYLKVRLGFTSAVAALLLAAAAHADATVPSGEVEFAHSRVEPVYNNLDGSVGW
jgi:hypothetical protein